MRPCFIQRGVQIFDLGEGRFARVFEIFRPAKVRFFGPQKYVFGRSGRCNFSVRKSTFLAKVRFWRAAKVRFWRRPAKVRFLPSRKSTFLRL